MKGLNPGRLKKSKSKLTPQNIEFTVKYTFRSGSPYNDDLTGTNNIKKYGTMRTKDIINGPHSIVHSFYSIKYGLSIYYIKCSSDNLRNENINTGFSREMIFKK